MIDLLLTYFTLVIGAFTLSSLLVELIVYSRQEKSKFSKLSLSFLTFGPVLISFSVIAAFVFSTMGKSLGFIVDHCLAHGLNHPHLCLEHMSAAQVSFLTSITVVAALVFFAAKLLMFTLKSVKSMRLNSQLKALNPHPFNWVDSSKEMAFVTGFHQPRIYLTQKLRQRLSKSLLRVVVAHEIQHIRNRDLFKMAMIELTLCFFSRATKNFLRKAWVTHREKRIDLQLAQRFGRARVAEALISMLPVANREGALNNAGGDIEQRVMALVEARTQFDPRADKSYLLLITLTLLLTFVLTLEHHALETLIGWIN